VDQLRRHQLAEGALQRQSLKRRDRFQQAIREFAPDRCPDLCDLLNRRQPIQALHQRVLQGRGDCQRGHPLVENKYAVLLAEEARLKNGLGQLLDEQRHPIGLGDDLLQDLRRQRLAAGDAIHHRQRLPTPEAVELKRGDMRAADPRRDEFRAEGDHQQRAQAGQPIDEPAEHVERGRVDPVRILEQRQYRRVFRQPRE
jgi:hypothetical protein